MTINKLPTNFIYPEIKKENFIFGSVQVAGNIIRPDGDWRPYLPPQELQRRNGIESSACFIEAQQHTLATILEEEFGISDENYSARFNLNFSQASPQGGDPLKGAQTFRDYGLIPDAMLPFSDDIKSWEEFNSFKDGYRELCINAGKNWRKHWNPQYDIGFFKEESVEIKYQKLKKIIKHCPPPVSVFGWAQNENGLYIKPESEQDNHLVELVYIDENNCPYIWDTYAPFLKKLAPYYNFDFGMRWTINRTDESTKKNWLTDIIYNLWLFLKDIALKTK